MTVKQKLQTTGGFVTLPKLMLECGKVIEDVKLAYERCGPATGEVILVCHALTGNQFTVGTAEEPGWWRGLINSNGYVDAQRYQVMTFNVIGGCNGSTGPVSINPKTGEPYRTSLPFISVRDMVRAQYEALKLLGIAKLKAVIGGSLGGMQTLEWAMMYPEATEQVIVLAATPSLSDYGITYNAIARKAILDDPNWNNGCYSKAAFPKSGLSIARMLGMITYRSDRLFNQRFHRDKKEPWGEKHDEVAYQVESYLLYQGDKFTERFDPNSYLYLLKAMDHHDLEDGRGPLVEILGRFKKKVQLIAFQGDLLYPAAEMKRFGELWRQAGANVCFHEVETIFGHDGFLTEFEKWGNVIQAALKQ